MQNTKSTLPSTHAFIVQFQGTIGSTVNRYAGRVEHLVSGQAARFDSWERLQQFIAEVLAQVGGKLS